MKVFKERIARVEEAQDSDPRYHKLERLGSGGRSQHGPGGSADLLSWTAGKTSMSTLVFLNSCQHSAMFGFMFPHYCL